VHVVSLGESLDALKALCFCELRHASDTEDVETLKQVWGRGVNGSLSVCLSVRIDQLGTAYLEPDSVDWSPHG
jgi:hypothetical protein